MRTPSKFTCLFAASFVAITPTTPQQFLSLAKEQVSVPAKISILRQLSDAYPKDRSTPQAREQLVNLLVSSNRYEEALEEYVKVHPPASAPDFRLLELYLRTGRYNELLKAANGAPGSAQDILRDTRFLELSVQARLAKGQYRAARQDVERWLALYEAEGVPGSRFEGDVRNFRFLKRHLLALERLNGPEGKAIFTASVPDSLQQWSKRRDVPVVFFKLIPAHPGGQLHQPLLSGRHEGDAYFENLVSDLNRGFEYLSGDKFSLRFAGLHTLYVKEGDIDSESAGAHLVTSRVYVHTIPQLYQLAGGAFAVLVDYRAQEEGEAAYMGDGIIHLSATKLQTLIVMHEILHGLGATHQEWNRFTAEGYKFDPEDRGLMTFDHGEIVDLGLEEKNRALLGWPQVGVVRPRFAATMDVAERSPALGLPTSPQETTTALGPAVQRPNSSELLPSL